MNHKQMTFTANKKQSVKVEDQILADFMQLLDDDKLDKTWKKEWTATQSQGHINFLTNHAYQGANPIILEMYMMLRGHHLPLWVGYGQAKKDLNCIPRKGSKAAKILRPNPIKIDLKNEDGSPKLDKNGDQEFYMKLTFRGAAVFNISDLVGLDDKAQTKLDNIISSFKSECEKNVRPLDERIKAAHDRLMIFSKDLKNGLKHGGNQPYYESTNDFVKMPERSTFDNDSAYLSTLAHEFCHGSGHKDRLNRKWLNEYSKFRPQEEMCVEFASVLICNRLQIDCNTQNHAAYISGWVKGIKDAKSPSQELMKVFSNAVKAADLVIGEQ
tara:strand:- start:2374 stop:3354 length:981 start_codon:yes stop_codon:yes gene_type:complete